MVMLRYFVATLASISSLGLSGCDLFQSEEITLCQEAMQIDADQLKLGEVARNRLVSGCSTKGGVHTRDQWKCIIAEMKQGKAYSEADNTCGSK